MEKLDPLSPLGRKVLNETKARPQVVLDPDVLQLHVDLGTPVSPATARIVYLLSTQDGNPENPPQAS